MAVVAVWKCDRDGKMFDDKKAAEAHDKMLELAANITELIETSVKGISEEHSEAIGLLLAGKSEQLAKACKGKPEVLLEETQESSVTPLVAQQ
ncbi:YebG family protein [Gilvimarinus agarilyticus]|uniref:YebG family protein n=1 Tax=Gilvimarinus agarilyticus TaxID=679259 RepID=UPI0005A24479|nr:YebG family protein [Gilvimarinus agarilyticus]